MFYNFIIKNTTFLFYFNLLIHNIIICVGLYNIDPLRNQRGKYTKQIHYKLKIRVTDNRCVFKMEIVDENSVILSNFEVLSFLQDERNEISKNPKKKKNKDKLLTLILETMKYLGIISSLT